MFAFFISDSQVFYTDAQLKLVQCTMPRFDRHNTLAFGLLYKQ